MGGDERGLKDRIRGAAPVGILVLFWAAKTASLWRHLDTRHYAMRAPLVDTFHMIWQSWWTSVAVGSAEHSLLSSNLINHPLGSPSALDYSLASLHVGLAGLFRGAIGTNAAHNLVAIIGFTFSLVAVYLLLREVSGARLRAAVMTCLVMAAGLCVANELPDLELIFFGYLPLALFGWLRYQDRGSWRWLALAIGMVGLTAFSQMYYGIALFTILGTGAVLSLAGFPLAGVASRGARWRTPVVLVGGLALGALLHARNISNAVRASTVLGADLTNSLPWPFGLLDLLLLILLVAVPLALAGWLGSRRGLLWGILAAPIMILSAGYEVWDPWGGVSTMPLAWMRSTLPFIWRITFPERSVTPLVLLVGASVLASLRGAPRPRWGAGVVPPAAITVAAMLLFWVGSSFSPMVTTMCRFRENQVALGTSNFPPSVLPPGAVLDGPGYQEACFRPTVGGVLGRRLSRLFLPLETLPMPPTPRCIAAIAGAPGDFGLLELTTCNMAGYQAYFQTSHEKSVVGFPCRDIRLARRSAIPSPFSLFQEEYRKGEVRSLMSRETLAAGGIRYVVRYDQAGCTPWMATQGKGASGDGGELDHEDFAVAYGQPICSDELTTVYAVGSEGE